MFKYQQIAWSFLRRHRLGFQNKKLGSPRLNIYGLLFLPFAIYLTVLHSKIQRDQIWSISFNSKAEGEAHNQT